MISVRFDLLRSGEEKYFLGGDADVLLLLPSISSSVPLFHESSCVMLPCVSASCLMNKSMGRIKQNRVSSFLISLRRNGVKGR
jgi:hypothetical protein